MARIGHRSQRGGPRNEDFSFLRDLPNNVQLMIVGDFASSTWEDINTLAEGELEKTISDEHLDGVDVPTLLTSVALNFNNRLLNFKGAYHKSFQCCVAFAAISDAVLYYLVIGDCRISVGRNEVLNLLNGSVWGEKGSLPVSPLVTRQHALTRQPETPPAMVLGVEPVELRPGDVKSFSLKRDDLVLLYSDGVDKAVSPQRILDLVRDGSKKDDPDALVEKILTEVEINHGDDDRTVMVALGPHNSQRDQAREEQRQSHTETIGEITAKLKVVEKEQDKARIYEQYLKDIDSFVRSATEELKALRRPGPSESVSNKNIGEMQKQIAALKKSVDELTSQIRKEKKIQKGADTQAQEPVDVPQAPVEAPASETPPETTPEPTPATPSVEPKQNQAALTPQETGATLVREGRLLLKHGSIELVDEEEASRADLNSEIVLPPDETMRPGELTAFFLLLRSKFYQYTEGRWPPADLEKWIGAMSREPLEKLSQEDLLQFREWHWSIRKRRKGAWWWQNNQLTAEEFRKAEFFKTKVPKPNPPDVYGESNRSNLWSRIWERALPYSGFVLFGVVLFGILAASMWVMYLRSDRPANEPPAPEARWTVEYGADGRTILFSDGTDEFDPSFRIQYGDESRFKDKFIRVKFLNKEVARTTVAREAAPWLVTGSEGLKVPDNVGSYKVEEEDSSGSCDAYLKRVNKTLPDNVHNEVSHIEKLNPGVRCKDIQKGDELLVYIKPPPK